VVESNENPAGLTSAAAQAALREHGPNAIEQARRHPVADFARKLVGPVPWMLEGALVLELTLEKWIESAIIAFLLLFNATLSAAQERRARAALAALATKLEVNARVLRDASWRTLPAREVVPGDVIRVRVGDFVPADLRVRDGTILVDQSSLTGESAPVEIGPGADAYSGTTVRRGEATGTVTATGARSRFGRTAKLVESARTKSHLEELVFSIVRWLVALDAFLVVCVLVYAAVVRLPMHDVLPFTLVLLVAAVPVAMPATFTLASALASRDLSERGVLVTRLSAIDDAAAMNVLCSDKTGTLTKNQLTLTETAPRGSHEEGEVAVLAALASDAATQDPIDLAILASAPDTSAFVRTRFVPFDPATKRSEAIVTRGGATVRVVKGAPTTVAALSRSKPDVGDEVERLARGGRRVIAVAAGPEDALELVGLLALSDPPREDARDVVSRLRALGVRVVVVTGDTAETARFVTAAVGVSGEVADRSAIESMATRAAAFAGVFPEDKQRLVEVLQRERFVVGMTGDGVNDAPALRSAEVGVAVARATDVAKSSASVVLVREGLDGVVHLVETGRRVYQRMLTWALNKLVKTFVISLLLAGGLLVTGTFLTTPRHVLMLVFTNDFVTMTLARDRVSFSRSPDRWNVRTLVSTSSVLSLAWLAFLACAALVGRRALHLELASLQTLVFVGLVLTGQATIYLLRERRAFWKSKPGGWMLAATAADVVLVGALAWRGVLVAPVPASALVGLGVGTCVFAVALDFVKVSVTSRSSRTSAR
jgi:H+-transporting ATPase